MNSFNNQLNILALGEHAGATDRGDLRFFSDIDQDRYNIIWFDTKKNSKARFSHSTFSNFRRILQVQSFDFILCGRNSYSKSEFSPIRWLSYLWRSIKYPNSFASNLLIRERNNLLSSPKLVAINLGDTSAIDFCEHELFLACDNYFKRELPTNRNNLFLNTTSQLKHHDRVQEKFSNNSLEKIKPISLGVKPNYLHQKFKNTPKKYDLFFAGQQKSSTARSRGISALNALKQAGVRVFFTEERLSYEEFLKLCASSYLVWSPEGYGWDCYRHYESALVGSVPVINYPTIERYAPLVNGQHALYYGSEENIQNGDGLYQVILNALKHPLRLEEMGKLAREHVLKYHTHIQLAKYVLDQEIC